MDSKSNIEKYLDDNFENHPEFDPLKMDKLMNKLMLDFVIETTIERILKESDQAIENSKMKIDN